jgi:prepilin-type processing-associated H-X9-DG protein
VISNFCGMAYATPLAQGGQNASVSYFVNLDASEFTPQAILSGDRNLSTVTNDKRASDYDAFFSVEHRIQPDEVRRGRPYASLGFQKNIHNFQGNILLADGSVHPATGARVREQILASTNIHRLIFPFVPGKNE